MERHHVFAGVLQVLTLLNAVNIAYSDQTSRELIETFLSENCIRCHSDEACEGGLDLKQLKFDLKVSELFEKWVRVYDLVASGQMPPNSEPRPSSNTSKAFLGWLRGQLIHVDTDRRQVTLRRLNRSEYENTLSDLFGIPIRLKGILPEDPSAHGFDTVNQALGTSAEVMELYLEAADRAITQVFGVDKQPLRVDIKMPLGRDSFANRSVGDLFLKADDDSLIVFQDLDCPSVFLSGQAPSDGTYRVTIRAKTYQSKRPIVMAVHGGDVIVGRGPTHLVGYFDINPGNEWTTVSFEDYLQSRDCFKMTPYRLRAPTKGPDRFDGAGLMIGEISVAGPIENWPPPSHKMILGQIDTLSAGPEDIRKILTRFLPRVFRRPVDSNEVEPFVSLATSALDERRPFLEALSISLKAVLCSPEFLMRDESGDTSDDKKVSASALASRMSYFLWSSMPDDELFELTRSDKLKQSAVLHQQVERMLIDPKSERFVENFAGQWLGLRDIDFTIPDARLYPEFDEMLRYAIVEESQRFFREMLERNEPLSDFVDSNWTILNERLAIHYGIAGLYGQAFRRVKLPQESVRGGVITQASVLKVSANGTNTSPVVRGNWVLSNILGEPSPPPPPNIPNIEPDIRSARTTRQRLEKHRSQESCATCHDRIDPPGFALENFDPIGGYRQSYRTLGVGTPVNWEIDGKRVQFKNGQWIDPSGQLPDGRPFADIRTFKTLLRKEQDQIARCLAEKLLIYSLGRRLGFADRSSVQKIVNNASRKGYGFRSLIHDVIESEVFLKK